MTAATAPVMAVFCTAEHPITGAWCHNIACSGEHTSDGLDAWTTPTDNNDEEATRC